MVPFKGFSRYPSAPRPSPRTISESFPESIERIIGMFVVSLIFRHKENPSSPGSVISKITALIFLERSIFRVSDELAAIKVLNPAPSKKSRSIFAISISSSTMRTFVIVSSLRDSYPKFNSTGQ